MRDKIYVIGMAKSGNTWLARLLGDAINCQVSSGRDKPSLADEGEDRPSPYIIYLQHRKSHDVPDDGKIVFTHRDPRAIAVSWAHYWERDIDDVIDRIVPGWVEYMTGWLEVMGLCDCVTSYEELSEDTERELDRILFTLDILPANDLSTVVERQSFDARVQQISDSLPYGKDIQRKLMNVGKVDHWMDVLTDDQVSRVEAVAGSMMDKLSYERKDK